MLFIILGAFWTIHESVSVVMLSLPSSRASDEEIATRKKEVLEPKELLLALIFLIIADNALLLVSLVAMTASDIPNEQAIRHYVTTALLVNFLSDIIICSEGMIRTLTGEKKRDLVLIVIRRSLKFIAIILVCMAIAMAISVEL